MKTGSGPGCRKETCFDVLLFFLFPVPSNKLLDLFLEDFFLSECFFLTKIERNKFSFLEAFLGEFLFSLFAFFYFLELFFALFLIIEAYHDIS